MDQESLSHEDAYCLDVAGYLIVPNVLTNQEVQACNQALDQTDRTAGMLDWPAPLCNPFARLRDHPVLTWYLEQICFAPPRLDRAPQLINATTAAPLIGGNEPRDWSRAYCQQDDVQFCQGVLAVWALADVTEGDGGFTLIPGSHKSAVQTPADVLDGTDDMGLGVQPPLKAGDLLLCVENVLHGVRAYNGKDPQRLLAFGYIGRLTRSSNEVDVKELEPPKWADEMTPEQRIVMGLERAYPLPAILSDGQTNQIDPNAGIFHPATHIRDPNSQIDEKEFYFWDLCGHLVVRGVMDAAWLAAANAAIDHFADRIETGGDAARDSKRLAGDGLASLRGLFELPHPHCEPFRKMIAHPAVVQRMNWMTGSGFKLDAARVIHYPKGSSGHYLHSGPHPASPRNHFFIQNGRTYCETINVAWQLVDVNANDGGFVCLPGTHKSKYPAPESVCSCEDERGLVKHVEMKAGDVILFMGSGQIHGAYPWTNKTTRRVVLLNYKSRNID